MLINTPLRMNKSLPLLFFAVAVCVNSFAQKADESTQEAKFIGNGNNSVLAAKSSVADGNWTTGGTWNGGTAPAGSDAITVNHNVTVNTNLSISGGLTVASGASLVDPAGGTNYTLDVTGTANFNVRGTTTFGGSVTLQNTAILHVYGCATLTVGGLSLQNNTQMFIDSCATLVVNGNLNISNSNSIVVGGAIKVFGNVSASNNVTSSGSGFFYATGTITTTGSSNVMGSTGDCAVGPCYAVTGTIGSPPLPVTFTKFFAKQVDATEILSWQTASEQNNSHFEIQRSNDGSKFEIIGTQKSKGDVGGNSTALLDYSFEDKTPLSGYSYYRLRQVDFNGKSEYSKMISVNFEASKNIGFIVYPNPTKGEFSVDFKGIENNHEIAVNIVDLNGKIVYETTIYPENISTNSFKIVPTVDIPTGKYLVRMRIEGITHTVKMIVE